MSSENYPLPETNEFEYLASYFVELRLTFGYTDIRAWSDLTGVALDPWEVELLVSMSSVYRTGTSKYRAKTYDISPPYDGRTTEQRSKAIGAKFDAMIKNTGA